MMNVHREVVVGPVTGNPYGIVPESYHSSRNYSICPDSPPKIVGMAFVGLQQVWGVNRGVDRTLRGVSERIGNG